MIPRAASITHQHILSVINTECQRLGNRDVIRILDAGCGDGVLLAYLHQALRQLRPEFVFDLYGFDVSDSGIQRQGFLDAARDTLSNVAPQEDWTGKLSLLTTNECWSCDDGYYDIIVSNQVLEHVKNLDLFFLETNRALREQGIGIHLFPLRNYLYESHLNLPFVHKIQNHDCLKSYIKLLSRMGLGKYRSHRQKHGVELDVYAERHADYLHYYTNYVSYKQIMGWAKKHLLRASFRYTREFYGSKLRSMFRLTPRYRYRADRYVILDLLAVIFLKYISSVTLVLEKRETYRTG